MMCDNMQGSTMLEVVQFRCPASDQQRIQNKFMDLMDSMGKAWFRDYYIRTEESTNDSTMISIELYDKEIIQPTRTFVVENIS